MFGTANPASRRTITLVVILTILLVAGAMLTLRPTEADAVGESATSLFVKFDGLDGESLDRDHRYWSDATTFNQAEYRDEVGVPISSRRRGAAMPEPFLLTKQVDKSDPKIQEALVTGAVFPLVKLDLTASYTDGGRIAFYQYEMKNVQVSSYNIGTTGQDELTPAGFPSIMSPEAALGIPVAEIGLVFEEIKVVYTEIDAAGRKKGTVEWTWKPEANS